jgi:hypothetical protein
MKQKESSELVSRARGMVQMVGCLPIKYEALISTPNTTKRNLMLSNEK